MIIIIIEIKIGDIRINKNIKKGDKKEKIKDNVDINMNTLLSVVQMFFECIS